MHGFLTWLGGIKVNMAHRFEFPRVFDDFLSPRESRCRQNWKTVTRSIFGEFYLIEMPLNYWLLPFPIADMHTRAAVYQITEHKHKKNSPGLK